MKLLLAILFYAIALIALWLRLPLNSWTVFSAATWGFSAGVMAATWIWERAVKP